MVLHAEWIEATVLAPVPHRQFVFTVPESTLREAFRRAGQAEIPLLVQCMVERVR